MSGQLLNNPIGLLSLLGAKTMGKNPDMLADAVWPVVDVRAHCIANQLKFTSDFVAAAVLGAGAVQSWPTASAPGQGMITPNGKVRFPLAMAISVAAPAASAIKWTPILIWNSATGKGVALGPPMVVGASESPFQGYDLPKDLVLLPGMGFGYQVASLTGAAVAIATYMLYAELDLGG